MLCVLCSECMRAATCCVYCVVSVREQLHAVCTVCYMLCVLCSGCTRAATCCVYCVVSV